MSELLVRRGTSVVPFSHGILARSLLKLGLDSTRSYDIAAALRAEFLAEGMTAVTSAHLARLVAERLPRHADAEIAARYEKLRQFKRSQRPLVLLVGGSTGAGPSAYAPCIWRTNTGSGARSSQSGRAAGTASGRARSVMPLARRRGPGRAG